MKRLFLISFILFLLTATFSFAFASEERLTLTITPPLIKANISPGDSWSSSIKIVNNNPKDLEVFASIMDFKSDREGGIIFIKEGDVQDGEMFLLSQWIEISSEPILIPAYQSRQVPFVVRVPADAEPGGKYAAILIGTQPVLEEFYGAGIRISTLVSSLILANVRGEIIEEARIREFSTEKSLYQKPEVTLGLRIENIGNIHIQPQGEIRIFNFWGKERGIIPINHKTEYGNVLPQSVRRWNFIWKAEDSLLEAGRYKAVLTLMYGNEAKQTITRTIYFWILPLVPTLGIFGGIFIFFIITFLMIRAYVKRAIFLVQKEAGIIFPEKSTKNKVKFFSKALRRPIFEVTKDFQKNKLKKDNNFLAIIFIMKKYFLAILIFLIFISGAVAVFFYFKDVLREAKGFEIIIDEVVSEPQLIEESFFEKFEPTLEINKEELFIKILNGTGIRGEASKFAQELEGAGFKISVVANADSFDYQKTLIKYKIGKEREAELINQSLNYLGQLVEEENQEEDIIIIIGND